MSPNLPATAQYSPPAGTTAAPAGVAWRHHLPEHWQESVIQALDYTEHREYEMPASRCFGYDVDGQLCYYRHHYALAQSRSDDDEDFYQVLAYGETLCAWRLRDERWLIYRCIQSADDSHPGSSFYSFADHAPC